MDKNDGRRSGRYRMAMVQGSMECCPFLFFSPQITVILSYWYLPVRLFMLQENYLVRS